MSCISSLAFKSMKLNLQNSTECSNFKICILPVFHMFLCEESSYNGKEIKDIKFKAIIEYHISVVMKSATIFILVCNRCA